MQDVILHLRHESDRYDTEDHAMELNIPPAQNPQTISERLHKQIYIQYLVSKSCNNQHHFYNKATYNTLSIKIFQGSQIQYTGFRWENLKERDRLEDLGVDGTIILKCVLQKQDLIYVY